MKLKAGIDNAYDDALRLKDEKDTAIHSAFSERESTDRAARKEAGDEKHRALFLIRKAEKAQMDSLDAEVTKWENKDLESPGRFSEQLT
jgi:hypothetical protein